jgi:hypothetical protein
MEESTALRIEDELHNINLNLMELIEVIKKKRETTEQTSFISTNCIRPDYGTTGGPMSTK